MRELSKLPWRRARDLAFALCTAWLIVQNAVLFALFAQPLWTGVRVTATALLKVAIHAAAPATIVPSGAWFDVAFLLPLTAAAVAGVAHV